MTPHFLPSQEPPAVIGGKARGLSELLRWGFDVPRALVVPAAWPLDEAAVGGWLAQLGGPVAVRSSGVGEDGEAQSFAGMHDTVLALGEAGAVLAALARVRASANSDRARAYRGGADAPPIPAVVQRMVAARCAGVVFSCDPLTGATDRAVVEAVAGLGEALVSGQRAGDRATVARSGDVLELVPASPGDGCLERALAQRVAALAFQVADKAGRAVDVEWAWDGETVWLLQWRPVTAVGQASRIVWTDTNAKELLPEVARPMTMDVLRAYVSALLGPMTRPMGLDPDQLDVLGQIGGRVYFNMNGVLGWMRAFPFLRPWPPAKFAAILGGDQQALAAALAQLRPEDLPNHRLPWWRFVAGTAQVTWALLRNHTGVGDARVAMVRAATAEAAQVDVRGLSDEALAARPGALARDSFGGDASPDSVAPAGVGMFAQGLLPMLTRRWLDDATGALGRQLLSGIGTLASAESGHALRRLGQAASAPALRDAVRLPSAQARLALSQSDEGRRLVAQLDGFLDEHGHHARGEVDVSLPRWREEPELIWQQIQLLAQSERLPALVDPAARQRLEQQVAGRLGPLRRWLFRLVLRRALNGVAARENLKSEAIRRAGLSRDALLEVGRRLVARGLLDRTDDVFFLRLSELLPALQAQDPVKLKATIATRQQEHARHVAVTPPSVVFGRWSPSHAAPPPTGPWTAGTVIGGIAAGAGIAEGPARVIVSGTGDARLLPGEILVAPFTDPGWTPLFVAAKAVVMDFGGLLSHGAIVAREYGLPAVVNVGPATRCLRDGQRLRVDGDTGTVTVLSD